MIYLGIDYGARRIGIAVSDESGGFAFPVCVIQNADAAFSEIEKLVKERAAEKLVIGMPAPGGDLTQTAVRAWGEEIGDKLGLPVVFQDETLTSHFASGSLSPNKNTSDSRDRMKGSTGGTPDATAAALILQRYLDKTLVGK